MPDARFLLRVRPTARDPRHGLSPAFPLQAWGNSPTIFRSQPDYRPLLGGPHVPRDSAPMLPSQPSESRWHYLYRTAAIAALITVALFLFQIVAFFVWPPPSTVADHFALLHSRTFVGLVSLGFLIIIDEVLAIPLFLALYLSLCRVHESLMLIATALSAASIVCILIATPALNMSTSASSAPRPPPLWNAKGFSPPAKLYFRPGRELPFRWAMWSDRSACC